MMVPYDMQRAMAFDCSFTRLESLEFQMYFALFVAPLSPFYFAPSTASVFTA
jgi:hypothetical protein